MVQASTDDPPCLPRGTMCNQCPGEEERQTVTVINSAIYNSGCWNFNACVAPFPGQLFASRRRKRTHQLTLLFSRPTHGPSSIYQYVPGIGFSQPDARAKSLNYTRSVISIDKIVGHEYHFPTKSISPHASAIHPRTGTRVNIVRQAFWPCGFKMNRPPQSTDLSWPQLRNNSPVIHSFNIFDRVGGEGVLGIPLPPLSKI